MSRGGAGAGARRRERRHGASTPTFTVYSPTARAEQEHTNSTRPDRRIALGSPHQMTRKAHQFCAGGCGSHSDSRCGGRWWATKYPASTVAKNDDTMRIGLGLRRAQRIRERGW